MITLAPDAPNWATAGGRGGNYKVDSNDFADFARAVGQPLLGHVRRPARREVLHDLERAQPHLLPEAALAVAARVPAPGRARRPGAARRGGPGNAGLRRRARARSARPRRCSARSGSSRAGCAWTRASSACAAAPRARPAATGFKKVTANGFAHHPYGPTGAVPARRDIINISVIRRLATVLDKAARAGRITARPRHLQHRVRLPDQPAGPVHLDLARPPGGAAEREGGVLLPLLAAEELLAVPALRRSGPLRALRAQVGRLPDRA